MKVLIIQTAFLGDVILATPLIEALHEQGAEVHFMCRRGNQSLLTDHPKIAKLWVFDKSKKYTEMLRLVRAFRQENYDTIYNLHRFFTSGLITVLAGARSTVGFDKNPLSRFYTHAVPHIIDPLQEPPLHEVDRNLSLLRDPDQKRIRPRLYPSDQDYQRVSKYSNYITISPASVWYTKQYPKRGWIDFLDRVSDDIMVLILGAPGDAALAEDIRAATKHKDTHVLAGELSLLQSTALMQGARMNYTNDSAPTHMASSGNSPVTTLYCSTIPEFGFGPLSDESRVLESTILLDCRPCGLHGHKECPLGTFACAQYGIEE